MMLASSVAMTDGIVYPSVGGSLPGVLEILLVRLQPASPSRPRGDGIAPERPGLSADFHIETNDEGLLVVDRHAPAARERRRAGGAVEVAALAAADADARASSGDARDS